MFRQTRTAGRRGGDKVTTQDITATVHLDGVDGAVMAAAALAEKISEAKTPAGELALLIERLEVKVDV